MFIKTIFFFKYYKKIKKKIKIMVQALLVGFKEKKKK